MSWLVQCDVVGCGATLLHENGPAFGQLHAGWRLLTLVDEARADEAEQAIMAAMPGLAPLAQAMRAQRPLVQRLVHICPKHALPEFVQPSRESAASGEIRPPEWMSEVLDKMQQEVAATAPAESLVGDEVPK